MKALSWLGWVALAVFAAYALAWFEFKGRDFIFFSIFALQVIPLQLALVPLLQLFAGCADTVWHTRQPGECWQSNRPVLVLWPGRILTKADLYCRLAFRHGAPDTPCQHLVAEPINSLTRQTRPRVYLVST